MADNTETSLRDDLMAGLEPSEVSAPNETGAEELGAPPIPAELPPLEAPSVWGSQYKESFQKIAQTPEQRAVAETWLNQWKETQGYITKRDQEFAEYRKSSDPIREVIQPYEQYWKMQGMDPRQGLSQIMSYAEQLARDPRNMIPQLAKMYNVDLQELIADQPYVDPQVAQLQAKLQAIEAQNQQNQQYQQQQMYTRLVDEVRAFETAVDESGAPKHPHFSRVFDHMVGLAKGGLASSIQDAYEKAVYLDKDLQAEISTQRAQVEAVARAAEAKKALAASKAVSSKSPTDHVPPEKSMRDELLAQLEAAGYQ